MDLKCKCGRVMGIKPHCPRCGSPSSYPRAKGNKEFPDGDTIRVLKGYRCRSCGNDYTEGMECQAPITQVAMKEYAAAEMAMLNMSPVQRERILAEAKERIASRTPEEQERIRLAQEEARKRLGLEQATHALPDVPDVNPAPGPSVEDVDPMKDILG